MKTWAKDLNRHLITEDIQMANIKRGFALHVVMEMQVKKTRYHYLHQQNSKNPEH